MSTVLSVTSLDKSYGDAPAVKNLSFEVSKGEVFGLIGPDGAGKTTALRCAAGLMRPTGGRVRVLDFEMPKTRRLAASHMGYMPQQYSLYGDLSVSENFRFFAGLFGIGGAERDAREKRLLEMARLDRFHDRPARALSGGMYKKLALCCALVHEPALLLLDEPTNGVDPISRRELWSFLYELLGGGIAVVISTPYMDEAERCARVGLMHQGRLLRCESPSALVRRFSLTVFELRMNPLPTAADARMRDPAVVSFYLVGRRVHVISPLGPTDADTLASSLRTSGFAVESCAPIAPSFEDVFLHVTAQAEKGERA